MPPARPRRDANEAFRPAAQPPVNDLPGGEPPKLVFRTPPSDDRPPEEPWNPWADGPPQPDPAPPPARRTKRAIIPNPDGTGWRWGEVEDDSP
ncbi:hypothetical protein GCM10010208_70550 [Actinomadura livida]|nr:hypothetical protein GCM10010208_70550 [Actinomadura livida]